MMIGYFQLSSYQQGDRIMVYSKFKLHGISLELI